MNKYFNIIKKNIWITLWTLISTAMITSCMSQPPVDEKKETIVCLGDSITYGLCLLDRHNDSYPARLYSELEGRYNVINLGISGMTASRQGDRPMEKTKLYETIERIQPDFLIFMLGSNDSKRCNWKDGEHFYLEYGHILDKLPLPTSRILAIPSPRSHKNRFCIRDSIVSGPIREATIRALTERNIEYLLVDSLFTHPNTYIDGVHPRRESFEKFSELIGERFKYMYQNVLLQYN